MHVAFQKMWSNNLNTNARSGENNLYQHYARELPIDANSLCSSNITSNSQSGLGIGIAIPANLNVNQPIQIKPKSITAPNGKRKHKSKKAHQSHKKVKIQAKKRVYKAKKKQVKKNKKIIKKDRKSQIKNKIIPTF